MAMKIEKVNIEEVTLNPNNPRIIKDNKFKKLIKSIKEFPQMLEVRPIVVDDDMVILGGNMRLKACIEAGLEEIFIIRFEDLTDEQKEEFIVKDNVGFGEWDFDILKNEWDKDKLLEWGMDLPKESKLEDDIKADEVNSIYVETSNKDKQKDIYEKLIEFGIGGNDIKLMNFDVKLNKPKEVNNDTKFNFKGNKLEFKIDRINECNMSYNVKYVLDKFDMDPINKERFEGLIDLDFDWDVGLIVGNSGSGKSTIAKELFGDNYVTDFEYDDNSILDNFDGNDIDNIIDILTSVGLASTTTWLKPYKVLSGGEKMRCDLARSILSKDELIVFDEFTSVVDRNVAKIGSFVTQKNVRRSNKKFIAVGCHFDVEDWLMPDWVFNTNEMKFYKYEDNKKKSDQVLSLELLNVKEKKKKKMLGECLVNTTI